MPDLRLAAWFLWMTPLLAALSSALLAVCSAVAAASASPASAAVRKCRTAVFRADLTATLRCRAPLVGLDPLDLGLDVRHA